jgi:hypothetical protein
MKKNEVYQGYLPGMAPYETALKELQQAGIEERGAVFTRREVVEFILDLVGYTADKPLHRLRLLEPSCGDGNFLLVAAERLIAAWKRCSDNATSNSVEALAESLVAVELHTASLAKTKQKLTQILQNQGFTAEQISYLLEHWLISGDFLLVPLSETFHYVIGNPPYVRQELIPDELLAEYRQRYRTIYDRADLYIPFIERSLSLLATGGTLGFICSNRWMKNRYGGPLRQLVAEHFHLKFYIDMVDTPAFLTNVIAYPAIAVISRQKPGKTRIAYRPNIHRSSLQSLAKALTQEVSLSNSTVKEISDVALGSQPWILDTTDDLSVVRRLEQDFPPIENTGCKVGIGVATGADKVFIGLYDRLNVEEERKLPLATTRDLDGGRIAWQGWGIVNPFDEAGNLVELDRYPRMKAYLEAHKKQIASRYIARKNPNKWYRTIDRIYPRLARIPKLLIPDIQGTTDIIYEEGRLYPHHNIYYILSQEWDLKALQAVLRSELTTLFVSTYSTRIRGGYLRFQAQYLRRIRLPYWQDVSPAMRKELVAAATSADPQVCNEVVSRLYGLSEEERAILEGNADRLKHKT